jgi:hypothetical protein
LEVLKMAEIKELIKMLRRQKQLLVKARYVRGVVRYNLEGEDYEVEFDTSDEDWHYEAADLFFDEVRGLREKLEDVFPVEVKDIAADVVKRSLWFKITPVESDAEVTEDWAPIQEEGVTRREEKVFVVDGKKYLVEKDPQLELSQEDVEKLVRNGLLEMRVDSWEIYEWEPK